MGSHDGDWFTWYVRQGGKEHKLTAKFSRTLLSIEQSGLSQETREAIRTKGRSVIEDYAERGEIPPPEALIFTSPVHR